jgi:osmoprotectant transport system permease protein
LGTLFTEGSQLNSLTPILLGLIMIVVLALVFDGVILVAMRLLTPWQRAVRS